MTPDVLPIDKKLNLGQLREFTKDWPDSTPIIPDFLDPPGDDYPSVRIEGFAAGTFAEGGRYLSVVVHQIPLQGDCQCESCGACYSADDETLEEHEPDEDELEDDSPKPVGVCPCGGLCYEY